MPEQAHIEWDDVRLKRERLQGLQGEMKGLGLGGLYISDGVNLHYVLNLKIPGAKLFVPAEGEPVAFVRPRDAGYVSMQHERIMPTLYSNTWEPANDEKLDRFAQTIADLMAEHGAAGEPLGVDPLEAPAFHALIRAGVPVADARPAIERAKSIKTQDELAIYRLIGEQYSTTYTAFREAIRPGATEKELAVLVGAAWYEAGGDDVLQLNVCAGEHMNPWRRWPTQRALQAGEFVGIDFHAGGVHGIRGDVSRTFFVGDPPSAEQRDLYRQAWDYLEATTDAFRGGRAIADVVKAVPPVGPEYYEQLYNYNIGHPIGLTPSGYPHVDKDKRPVDDVLKPGQVFAVECYFGAKGSPLAVKLEHMIVVRDGEPEILDAAVPFDERLL